MELNLNTKKLTTVRRQLEVLSQEHFLKVFCGSIFLFEIKVDKGYPIFITNLVCQKIVEKFFNVLYNVFKEFREENTMYYFK